MISFPRYYRPCATVIVAGQTVAHVLGEGLRIAFSVRRTMTSSADSAEISIWNLAPERRVAMSALFAEIGRAPAQILAGYDALMLPVFTGDVRSMSASESDGPDIVTRIQADDGGDAIANVTLSISTAGLTAQNMIDVALAAFAAQGHPIVAHPSVAQCVALASPAATSALYAAVHVGKASQLLDEAARTLGCRWWIRDSQLFMAARQLPPEPFLSFLLPRTHWLSEPSDDGSGLVRFDTLFDPNIVPGRQVILFGRVGLGSEEPLRVEATTHTLDVLSTSPPRVSIEARRIAV